MAPGELWHISVDIDTKFAGVNMMFSCISSARNDIPLFVNEQYFSGDLYVDVRLPLSSRGEPSWKMQITAAIFAGLNQSRCLILSKANLWMQGVGDLKFQQ